MDWMAHWNSCVETWPPGRWCRRAAGLWDVIMSWRCNRHGGICALNKAHSESCLAPSAMGGQREEGHLWTRKPSAHSKSANSSILDFSASRMVRCTFLLFVSHSVYSILFSSPNGQRQERKEHKHGLGERIYTGLSQGLIWNKENAMVSSLLN